MNILEKIKGTYEYDIITALDAIYREIERQQAQWLASSRLSCVDGCGKCCVNFEPDVLESEALYLACFLLSNQEEKARTILDGSYVPPRQNAEAGCFLFDEISPYHCTVYGGRCCICRLFGYSGARGKDGTKRFKPCRFYGDDKKLAPLTHREYTESELRALFGDTPPAMSDIMEKVLALTPDSAGTTRPLRQALPDALRRILFLLQFSSPTQSE